MAAYLTPTLLLLATAAALLWTRPKSLAVQVVVETTLILILGGWLLRIGTSPIPTALVIEHRADGPWIQALSVTWWLVASRLVVTATSLLRGRNSHSREAKLASDLFAGAIYLTSAFIILNTVLALPIRGLLATSGVIAIVVGLALQSTLADLFSGIAVGIERSIQVGDLISLDDATEGKVVQLNWRSVHLRTAAADVAIVPNSIVAKSRIINRSRPTERRAVTTDLDAWYEGPSHRLLKLVREAVLLCPSILAEPPTVATIKTVRRRRLVIAVSYSVASSELIMSAHGELLQSFRRLLRHTTPDVELTSLHAFLSEVVLFETLSAEQIGRIAEAVEAKEIESGSQLFKAGTVGASLFIVRAGVLDLLREDGDAAHSLGRIGPGEYIGELSMMTGEPRHVSAYALTPVTVLELGKAPLEAMLKDDDKLGRCLEMSVSRGMELVERDAAARASAPIEARRGMVDRLRRFLRC